MAPWQPQPQEEFVPYWTLEPGWDTALQVRNNVTGHLPTSTRPGSVPTGPSSRVRRDRMAPTQPAPCR